MILGYEDHRHRIARLKGMDCLIFGLCGQLFSALLIFFASQDVASSIATAAAVTAVVSTGVLIGGCAKYARYHGLSPIFALLGLFNIVGVLILVTLPAMLRPRPRGDGFSVIFAEPYRRDVWRMDVRVRLDDSLGAGVNEPIMLQLPRGANIGTAMKTLAGVIPILADGQLPEPSYTINGARADRRDELTDGDEMIVRKI